MIKIRWELARKSIVCLFHEEIIEIKKKKKKKRKNDKKRRKRKTEKQRKKKKRKKKKEEYQFNFLSFIVYTCDSKPLTFIPCWVHLKKKKKKKKRWKKKMEEKGKEKIKEGEVRWRGEKKRKKGIFKFLTQKSLENQPVSPLRSSYKATNPGKKKKKKKK